MTISNALNLMLLDMCEKILPNTRMANNKELKSLLEDIRSERKES